jgi:CRP/FNR family transcriptional regulator, cyclic AMP receptor protein
MIDGRTTDEAPAKGRGGGEGCLNPYRPATPDRAFEKGYDLMTPIQNLIANHPFFTGFDPKYLATLAKGAKQIRFGTGDVIFREGEAAYQFYLIQEGKIALETHRPDAGDVAVQVLDGGDVLGWSWLFPPFQWHFQARAIQPTQAIFLDGAHLLVSCEENRNLGYELLKRIAQVVIKRLQATRQCLVKPLACEGLPSGSTKRLPALKT